MNFEEHHLGETELRRIRPAPAPPELRQRLLAARPRRLRPERRERGRAPGWTLLLRWLIPATAIVVAILIWRTQTPLAPRLPTGPTADAGPAVKADDVEIGEELISSFDTVARLPGGEPVRFRCREWMDEVVLRDKERGLTIEQRNPRVEVIPVRFETY